MTNKIFLNHPRPWKVVGACTKIYMNRSDLINGIKYPCEDCCIVDGNNVEVIGCSEWMRGEENLRIIVDIINNPKRGY